MKPIRIFMLLYCSDYAIIRLMLWKRLETMRLQGFQPLNHCVLYRLVDCALYEELSHSGSDKYPNSTVGIPSRLFYMFILYVM